MGRGVARLYAKRREALDQYVPMWVLAWTGQASTLDRTHMSGNPLKSKAGQDGQDKRGTKTATSENTKRARTQMSSDAGERRAQKPCSCTRTSISRPVHPVHPVPASNGAGSSLDRAQRCAAPPVLSELRPWTDDRGWIAEIVRAAPGDPKLAALFWWVIAAGGWIEGTTR